MKAIYNDGSERVVTSGFVADYDFSTSGTKTVTIEYEGLTVSYDVTVESVIENTDKVPGDINGDGSVDVRDVIFLRRYIAGGYGIEL